MHSAFLKIHQGEESGRSIERTIQELQISGIHHDLERTFGGFFQLPTADVDGNDVLSFQLPNDALSPTTDIQDLF